MAATQISDIFEPVTFGIFMQDAILHKSAFFQSGVTVQNAVLSALCAQNEGGTFNIPRFSDIPDVDPNLSSDNPAETATPGNITQPAPLTFKHRQNMGWSSMDLVAALNANGDPLAAIASQVGGYWARAIDKMMIQTMDGQIAALELADAGAYVHEAGNIAAGDVGVEIVTARGLMGDRADELTVIVMNSDLYTHLNQKNLIDFIPDSDGRVMFQTYQGMRCVVSDAQPALKAVLCTAGTLMYGNGAPKTPSEVERVPASGNGEGEEQLWSRNHYCATMDGISVSHTFTTGKSPTLVEAATAGTWTPVYTDRKRYHVVQMTYTFV